MFKRIIPLLTMGYALWRWNRQRVQGRQRKDGGARPLAESRWEGEGGALRDSVRSPTT